MARAKMFPILLVAILLLISILARSILSGPVSSPPGVPESWKYHKDVLGRFGIWLPEEWEDLGTFRTIENSLRDAVEGDESPILFAAFGSRDRCFESIVIESCDRAFEIHVPLVGEGLAREFVRVHPVVLTDEAGRNIFPEPSTDIVTIKQGGEKVLIAYQSYVLQQNFDADFVRTIACAVTRSRVYGIHLDTIERGDSTSIPPIYERILETFQVLK